LLHSCVKSLFIKFNNFRLQIYQVRRLHIELLILLLEHCQVFLQLHLFLHRDLPLHSRQSLLLSLLGNLAFEALIVDALLQHLDLVLVEGLNVIDHSMLLLLFLFLSLTELTLFFQQFVLF
jgi:hypothetical protein